MSLEHEITKRAADGSLTIGELREFLDEFDKATASPDPDVVVHTGALKLKARVGFKAGIKSITVTIGGEGGR